MNENAKKSHAKINNKMILSNILKAMTDKDVAKVNNLLQHCII